MTRPPHDRWNAATSSDRKSTRLNSSHSQISYAVFCLKKKMIVDEFTGRTMPGRRWSEGLHQAVEAKECVHVKGETQTMTTITIHNYFLMYDKLAGMT